MSWSIRRVLGAKPIIAIALVAVSFTEAVAVGPPLSGEQWRRTISTPAVDFAGGVGVDQLGNLYVTGDTFGQLATPVGGFYDGYVAKYSPDGNQLWVRQFGGPSQDASPGIAVTPTGDFVVAGSAGSGFGGPSLGSTDGFVRKYNSDGIVEWTTRVGTELVDSVIDVALSTAGNSFVAGWSSENVSPYRSSGIVSKLSPTGAISWTRTLDATLGSANAFGVAVDSQDASFVVGQSNLMEPLVGSSESGGAFVRKFDADGSLLWTRQFGDDYSTFAYDVAVDSQGNAYVSGQGFIRKLSADGEFLWDRQFGGHVSLTDVSLDGLGRVAFGGSWNSVPFYGFVGEDGVALNFASLGFESGYAANIAADGAGNLYISQTVQAANSFDVQLWKITYVPEPHSMALAALGLGVVAARRQRRR